MSSQYEARRAEARARTENMNVDETVELDNTEADEENKEQPEVSHLLKLSLGRIFTQLGELAKFNILNYITD